MPYVRCPCLRGLLAQFVNARCARVSPASFLCLEHVKSNVEGMTWGTRLVILVLAFLAYHSCKDQVGDKPPAQRQSLARAIFGHVVSKHRQHLQMFLDALALHSVD